MRSTVFFEKHGHYLRDLQAAGIKLFDEADPDKLEQLPEPRGKHAHPDYQWRHNCFEGDDWTLVAFAESDEDVAVYRTRHGRAVIVADCGDDGLFALRLT